MKKMLNMILAVMLIITTLPTISFADGPIVIDAYADVIVQADKPWQYDYAKDKGEASFWNAVGASAVTNRANIYYAFDVPEIPDGHVVESAIFSVYMKTPAMSNDGDHMRFYLVDKNWESASVCFKEQPLTIETADTSKDKYMYPVGAPDMTYVTGAISDYQKVDIDIAPLLNKYLAKGNRDVRFSFLMASYCATQTNTFWVKTKENSDASLRPTLTINTEALTDLSLVSSTPENGSTIDVDDAVSFTFNYNIDESSVTPDDFTVVDFAGENVAVSDSEIAVSGTTVSLNKLWNAYESYSVTLTGVADKYGQEYASSCTVNFNTGSSSDTTKTSVAAKNVISMKLSGDSVNVIDGTGVSNVSGTERLVVYRFDLSQVDSSKILTDAEFSWWEYCDTARNVNVTVVPAGTWSNASDITVDYYNSVASAMDDSSNVADTVYMPFGPGYSRENGVANVTSAVDNALQNDEQVAFAFTYRWTDNYYTNYYSEYAPSLNLTLVSPSFDVIEAIPSKGGEMDGTASPVVMSMATTLVNTDDNLAKVKLVRVYDDEEIEANVSFDIASNKLTVTPVGSLEERLNYKVIFESGLEDTFGNTLTSDKVATVFTCGTALECFAIKFTNELTPVYDTCVEIGNYTANSSVTAVAKIKNNSSEDLDAVMIVALYDGDDSLISVDAYDGQSYAPANDETQYSKTITIPQNVTGTKVKAFIIDGLDSLRPLVKNGILYQANQQG